MKILWIVNTPIDILGERLYGKKENGLWMDAMLSDYRKHGGFDLVVATTAKLQSTARFKDGNIVFYALPNNVPLLYNDKKASNQSAWDSMISKEVPDLIQVWGTEFSHGLCALKSARQYGIPAVIYMQGYLGSISRYYTAGMTVSELKQSVTFRDLLKHDCILNQQKEYSYAASREIEEFSLAGRIICENDWCENSVRAVSPGIRVYRCPLSINTTFTQYKWDIKDCEKHSIICNASGYPLKGLHMLLRAVALIKKDFPDVKLYVPGKKMTGNESFIWKLRKRGYDKYIEKLIKALDLSDNVVWLGPLTQDELAKQYAKTHVFVLCSAIENHSSSLKEAMIAGMPCVASAVGGVPEYVQHGENGFLYRFEEYDIAVAYIKRLFESDDLAQMISNKGHTGMIELHENNAVFERMLNIYGQILKGD